MDEEVGPLERVVLFLDPALEGVQHLDELEGVVDDPEVSGQSQQVEPVVDESKDFEVSLSQLFRQGHAEPAPHHQYIVGIPDIEQIVLLNGT